MGLFKKAATVLATLSLSALVLYPLPLVPTGENRLIHEKSPYLLQHADNPIDWYPWGEEALATARNQSKPIFLSIGYSTCHWCHVMERESFSNQEVAAILNHSFVSIKVDREERPDLDQIYMRFVQSATGRGGWPMSVFLTPSGQPFFGGTYFPRDTFLKALDKVSTEWETNRDTILRSAGQIQTSLQQMQQLEVSETRGSERAMLQTAFDWFRQNFDGKKGGFTPAPKFPRPASFFFLLRYHDFSQEPAALEMVRTTLRQMSLGGIHDHIGGGFHRYATDQNWFLPHFEKMLYDQAQIAAALLETHQITGELIFAEVATRLLDYVLRDMTDKKTGAFFSAEDADSSLSFETPEEHAEGAFYVWTKEEIQDVLGGDSDFFCDTFGVKAGGNVQTDPFGEFQNKNILFVENFETTFQEQNRARLERAKELLQARRNTRPRPLLDDKIITAWNGLMISAMAKAYQILGEERYLRAAERAAQLVSTALYDPASRELYRRYRQGSAGIEGKIDDYAFFIQGLLDLYETTLQSRWLELAMDLAESQNRLFWDETKGGYFNTTGRDKSLLVRIKSDFDGAEPAANSVAALNLLRLAGMAKRKDWHERALGLMSALGSRLSQSPHSLPQLLGAVTFEISPGRQILLAGDRDTVETKRLLRIIHRHFLPNKVLVLADKGPAHRRLAKSLDILDNLTDIDGKTTAYVCRDYICNLPTNDPEVLDNLLRDGASEVPP